MVVIEVFNWQETSAACKAYIAQYHSGGDNWIDGQIGADGRQIARVSTAIIARIEAYPGDWQALLTKIVQEHQETIAILER